MVTHAYLFPEQYQTIIKYNSAGEEIIVWQLPAFYVWILEHQIALFALLILISLIIIYIRRKKIKDFYYKILKGIRKLDS